uniref:Outer membrane transport energization protein ExbD n=1 Tax=Chlorobium chlorochromatii (strain CaD3) TaxID=340177 RepID=Q3AT52_CHLCH
MARHKSQRKGIRLDMTPMVDVAFLLLTFFMLAARFRPPETLSVTPPASHSTQSLPDADLLTITVSRNHALYLSLSSKRDREALFNRTIRPRLQARSVSHSAIADSLRHFRISEQMPLQANELGQLIAHAKAANPELQAVIRADGEAALAPVNEIMQAFRRAGITTFHLVTMPSKEAR